MDNEFENIVPWNGANDTGKDVRLKWQRNFERIKANFEELLELIGKVDIQELSKFFLRKDKSDSTDFAVQFNDGVKIGKSWIRWDEINNALYIIGEDGQSKVNFYCFGEVAAGGPGSSSGEGTGGLDENQLWAILANTGTEQISKNHLTDALSAYATENWVLAKNYLTSAALSGYATQSWVTAQGYITSAALEGYATIADVDNRIDDLINGAPAAYDTLKEIADVLQGNVDSIGDIITTLGTKADKAISISAGTGLTGGGNLSASRTLSLATVGTAGTYTKVIVDAYGRVTGHSALAEADIPTLSIAKISGLQTALDNKLDESVFTDLFEKVQVDGNTFIKAKYNLFSIGEVAAGGAGTGSGSSGGIDEAQLWSILGNSGTEQIAKNHLTTALSGYATETWVTGKGYATQSWVSSKGYITSAALEGYATESWVTGKNYLTAITKAMVEAVLTGNITTHTHSQYLTAHQAIYALTIKAGSTTAVTFSPKTAAATLTLEAGSGISLSADATAKKITIANTYKYTLPTASASVLGGVKIGANITITNGVISTHAPYSHPTATANTIAAATGKVLSAITVNSLGHVTSVAAKTLAAGDIPTLSISKISGLQTSLDSKLNASVFNDLFEKVTEDGQTFIKAKYNFYSVGEVAAGGTGTGSGSTGGGIDEEQLWAILSNTGTEQIAKNHLTTALTGYATQSWVTSQNYLKTVSLATISDLHANWDALLKVAPSAYITRWPSISEVTSKQNLVVKLNSGTTEGTNMFTYNVTAAKTINITPSAIGAAASSHNHSWANITSGKPTTLAGYGITDGVNAVSVTGSGNAITAASVSGHTLTLTKGSTFLLSSAYTAADILAKLKTVDGSGSGLDADTIDTYHATSILKRFGIDIDSKETINVEDYVKSNYHTKEAGNIFSVSGWAWASSSYIKLNDTYTIDRMRYSIVSYRNGDINNSWQQQALLFLPTYTDSSMVYLVQMSTSETAGIVSKSIKRYADYDTIINGNIASATKLQTPRTLWGRPFDGTANVSGALTGVTDITSSGNIKTTSLHANNGGYVYTDSGWFQNNTTGKGLYNSAEDARWYASSGVWIADKPIRTGSTITASRIIISSTSAVEHIEFSRAGYNYLRTPSDGTIAFDVTGGTLGSANCSLIIESNSIRGGTTNSKSVGTSTYRWSNIYSVLGNFSGLITATAGLTTPQYIQIGSGRIYWDATNNALYIKKSDDTACNFYSLGEIAAGGAGTGSGGTGGGIDEEQLWAILGNTGTEQIAKNHLTSALAGYLTSVSLSTIKDLHANWDAVLKVAPTSYVTRWPTFAEVTSKPTTLAGYGITDAPTKTGSGASGTWNISITGALSPKSFTAASDIDFSRPVWTATANITDVPSMSYAVVLNVGNGMSRTFQIWNTRNDAQLYWRPAKVDMSGYADVHKLLDNFNYTTILDTRYVKKAGDTMTGTLTLPSDGAFTNGRLRFGSLSRIGSDASGNLGIYAGGNDIYIRPDSKDAASTKGVLITATSFTYNNNKIWHAGNDGSGSSLDADLLDGLHASNFCRASFMEFGGSLKEVTTAEFVSLLKEKGAFNYRYWVSKGTWTYANNYVITDSGYGNIQLAGAVVEVFSQSETAYIIRITTSPASTSSGIINAVFVYRNHGDNYNPNWKRIANTTDNVASATKLQTPRTLWGQSFDGTANVSGTMNGVGSIGMTGNIQQTGDYHFMKHSSSTGYGSYLSSIADGSFVIAGHNNFTWTKNFIKIQYSNGYLGVGEMSPTYKLHVAGTMYASGAVTLGSTLTANGAIHGSSIYADTGYFYTQTGWFQNNKASTGLYNSAEDARWYASGGVWRADKGITTTGDITTNRIKITDTDAVKHIEFSRVNHNYITAPSGGTISFNTEGSAAASTSDLQIQSGSIHSGTTNATTCGTSTYRWSNVYSVLGNFSGSVTMSSTLAVSGTSTFTGKTTHNGGIACANGLTLNSGELMLGSSSNQKIRKGAASATYWSQLEFFGSAGSNGGFTDIMLNIQSSHTIQFDCGGNFIWFSKGNIAAKGELAAGSSSDRRLKKMLSTPDYRKRLLSLGDVVDYEYNDKAFRRNARTTEHRRYTGLIWQNVVNVLPQMAGKDDDGYGYLNYIHTDYINLIAGALQQTIRKQETIEQRVERLERENAELKQQLKRLAA